MSQHQILDHLKENFVIKIIENVDFLVLNYFLEYFLKSSLIKPNFCLNILFKNLKINILLYYYL